MTPLAPHQIQLTDRMVDLRREVVIRPATEHPLTTLEAALLGYLAARPSQDVSMDQLHREVCKAANAFAALTISTASFHANRFMRSPFLLSVYPSRRAPHRCRS